MLSILLVTTALLAGAVCAAAVPGRLLLPERAAIAAVVAVLGAAWTSFLLVLACGFAAGMVAAPLVLALLAALGGWRLHARAGARPHGRRLRPLLSSWLFATGLATALLVYLFSTHFLPDRDGGMGSAGSTWGDLAMHASLTGRFAHEPRFEWSFPLLYGAPLTYPFVPDFLSGVLERGGLSLRWALLLPTLLLATALVQLIFFAAWRAARSRRAAIFVLLLVLLDGSAAGLVVLAQEQWGSGTPFLEYLQDVRHDFAHVPAINARFSNIICDALLPQRGMLAGMAVFLVAALLLRASWRRRRAAGAMATSARSQWLPDGPLLGAGVLLGALPFVHIHTFLVLAGVLVWLGLACGVAAWHQRRDLRVSAPSRADANTAPDTPLSSPRALAFALPLRAAAPWLLALAAGALLAAPQLFWQLSHSFASSFSHWQLAWMAERDENPFTFWLKNLGVLLPLLVLAPALLERWPARGFWTQLVAALLAVFAIANVYLFQPHAYDNLKLLFYSYFALALVTARLLAAWWRRGGVRRVGAIAILVLATASGALSVFRESLLFWPFLTAEEVRLGETLARTTPPDARFLVADHHNHPVPIVAGRRIVLGYRGWLWTYGFDTAAVLADVKTMYAGAPLAEGLLRAYGVDYVVIGPGERKAFAVDEDWYARRFPLLLATETYRVYRVGFGGGTGDGTAAGAGGGTNSGVPGGSLPAKRAASK